MSGGPFGFSAPGGDDDPDRPDQGPGSGDPFAAMLGGQLDPAALGAAFQRMGQLLSWQGGPVNWDLARDVARQAVAGAGAAGAGADRSVGAAERDACVEAVRLAELWLDDVTILPAGTSGTLAWSRAEWLEGTLPAWRRLVDPVAARVVEAMGQALTSNVPEEMRGQVQAMAGPLQQMMRSMGGAMFGAQLGQALGSLAGEVVGSTDVGLPLGPAGRAVLVPANVAAFRSGLDQPADQVRLYLALRETAHHRLFGHVPWLRSRLEAGVEDYARGISIDTGRIEEQLRDVDPMNPQALQEALSGGVFTPQNSPAQEAALRRLETLLALVEGWVDDVVDAAAAPRLSAAGALRETLRRRRASGGPAEQTFAALVGLELRPRRLREAAALWHRLGEVRGADGRDAVWSHPDLLPGEDDLANPEVFAAGGGPEAPLDLSGLASLGKAPHDPHAPQPGSDDQPPADTGPHAGDPESDGPDR